MGLLFPIALIWAYTRPHGSEEIVELRREVDRLRDRVEAFGGSRASNSETGVPTS
jgi:hypothetical protein